MARAIRIAGLAAVLVQGCAWDSVDYVDEGQLCFTQNGDQVLALVKAPQCLSEKCSRDVQIDCEVSPQGADLRVETEIHWERRDGQFTKCDEDCGDAIATCMLGRLDDGAYTVWFGGDSVIVSVPVTQGCF